MKKSGLFAAFLLALVLVTAVSAQEAADPEPGAPGVGDSLYPDFGNGGYDAISYTVYLIVEPESGHVEGNVTMEAMATQDLSSLNLDFIGFEIEWITVNGGNADYSRDGQELTITPRIPIVEGNSFSVEVHYGGVPEPINSAAIPVATGWVRYDGEGCPCSFVMSEPDGTAGYIPINDHPLDKALYAINVRVPDGYEVATNGTIHGVIEADDGTTLYLSKVSSPMASYLLTINIGQFDLVTEEGTNGVPIRNYFAESVPQNLRDSFARQDEMIGYFETLFGEFPFDVYGSVVVDTVTAGALETQTLSIFGSETLYPDPVDNEYIVAHELAHQWFGDSISVADWSDIWLNEGFASYAEALWIEYTEGSEALEAYVIEVYDYMAGVENMPPPAEPPADDLFNDSVYTRGGLTLHALRVKVGDEVFFDILKTWYARYKDSNASTADFIAQANEVSGEDLSDFFDAWLYESELPPIPEMGLPD
jgi:aminopeptidase N